MATTTTVMEMQSHEENANAAEKSLGPVISRKLSNREEAISGPAEPIPENAVEALQKWNNPRINKWRFAAVLFCFINFGANDGSYGALIPYIEKDYHLSYTVTSLVFLAPFAGYTLSAFISDRIHVLFGRRGIAIINPICRLIGYIVISTHPPYPAVVCILAIVGLGNGFLDAGWNAWLGNLDHANELLGLMHGCYGLGATISPLVATTMITKGGLGWWTFFYIMAGVVTLELVFGTLAFWGETGNTYRAKALESDGEKTTGKTRTALKQKTTWLMSAFLLMYVGTEVSVGGWIVTFMINIRHTERFSAGLVATGFWLGITIGRVTLGFITPRIGERLAVSIYVVCAVVVELIFWLVPQYIVSAVAIAIVGFFIGPLFPSAVIMETKLLPADLHVAAIGFSAAFGGIGAAILPFVIGAVVQARGVQTLQPIILAMLVTQLVIWLMLPRAPKKARQA